MLANSQWKLVKFVNSEIKDNGQYPCGSSGIDPGKVLVNIGSTEETSATGIGMVFATALRTSPATRCIYNAIFLLNGTSFDIAIEKLGSGRPFFRSRARARGPRPGMPDEPIKTESNVLPFGPRGPPLPPRLMKIPIVNRGRFCAEKFSAPVSRPRAAFHCRTY